MPKHKQIRRRQTHSFAETPQVRIGRSRFDRSHGLKTTFGAGLLVPIFVDEVLPGDTFNLRMTAFARLATPIKPIMDNLYLETFFFFVPNRLVWNEWQQFMGEENEPGVTLDLLVPRIAGSQTVEAGTVADFFGLPLGMVTTGGPPRRVNALPFRGYNLIWNQWFRDQNLQERAVEERMTSGGGLLATFPIRRRGKRHDYFTSALPWPQKGESVLLPLGEEAPIKVDSTSGGGGGAALEILDANDDPRTLPLNSSSNLTISASPTAGNNMLFADLVEATAATINQLRQAFQVQKLLERNARGGTRYTEIIKSHFGVTSPDARLQRPEYLGGGRTMVNVSPIPQTSSSDETSEQGHLAAVGTALAEGHGFVKSFTEHGYVIGLCSVRADLSYQQGLDRMWSRSTRFDYYWPSLARIGEQAILSKEIFVGNASADDDVFGYQERYAEYRYKASLITNRFRSEHPLSLDVWHLAQDFETRPLLNAAFIEENPPVDRVIAVPTEPHFIMDSYFRYICARPMPVFGVPGMIDHF